MSRVFVIGDIHGAYRALRQCLDKAAFNYSSDRLICLGDVADGWPETRACIDELLRIQNLIYILGNHDWWTLQWMQTGRIDEIWYDQGGKATVNSYTTGIPESHMALLDNARDYIVLEERCFVHAGIEPMLPLEQQTRSVFLWDRTLAVRALNRYPHAAEGKITQFDEIYIGHTPISFPTPICSGGVWLMDTGAGWSGVLSIMNIETKECFTSEPVPALYPGIEGRRRFR